MASLIENEQPAWYTSRRFQGISIAILIAFALGEGFVGIFLRDNDFLWHRHVGEAFIGGDPYLRGGDHYLPARIMLNSITAWLPYRIDRAVVYLASLAALAWTLLAWNRLANSNQPLGYARAFAAIVFSLAITGSYLQRDLDECGLHILLLFFLTAAAVQLRAGHALRSGFWLGTAAAYKITPLLFLPYLCYKRQWRAAGFMVIFLGGWCLAPGLWIGWDVNMKAHERWWASTLTTLNKVDPSENGVERPNPRNQSLHLALARLVQTYPPGHVLYLDHPLFTQFGALEPEAAKRAVQAMLLVLGGILAWRFRRSLRFPESDGNFPKEWAAVTLLIALLSPMCWLQHLVLVVPAVYLLVRALLEPDGLSGWQRRIGFLAAIVMTFAGQRDLLGHSFFMLVMSYKVHTWAALLALGLVLTLRNCGRRQVEMIIPSSRAA